MKLITRILASFIGLVLLLSVIRTYSGVTLIEQIALNELQTRLSSDLNLLTFAIDRELYHIEKHLVLTSIRDKFQYAVQQRDIKRLGELSASILKGEDIDIVRFTDRRGKTLFTLQDRLTNYNIGIQAIQKHYTTKGFTLITTETGEFVALYVSVPIQDGNVFLGNLMGLMVIDRHNTFINNIKEILAQKADEPVGISIFSKDKRVFSTFVSETNLQEKNLNDEIVNTLYREGKNYVGRNQIGGTNYIVIYKPIKDVEAGNEWAYGIAINEGVLFSFKKRLLLTFVMISILATLAVIVVAFFITRGINPSLKKITDVCKEVEKGNMKIRINIEDMKIKEFHLIASFINKMVESINEREATINNNIEAIKTINAELEEKSKIIKFERKKFLAILETIDDGLISIDPRGAITYFNRAAEIITSIDRHMAIGRHYKTIFPSLDIHENSQVVAQELEINEPSSVLYLKLYISPYTLDSEEKGYILLFRDISKEKKIEEFKADFISSIAHDIKSFLIPVTGFLNRVLEEKYGHLEEPLRTKLQNIQENTSKIYQLVENYLNVSKIESGRLELSLAPSDVSEIVKDIVQLYSPRVKFLLEKELPLVLADRSYIERVMVNLIVNALKFSKESGVVFVDAKRDEDSIVISVRDRGIGIPSGEVQYIFEKYRRGSFGKRGDGSGLGLFIVKSIVEAHGGKIWVESVVGEGSTFYFTLPIFKWET